MADHDLTVVVVAYGREDLLAESLEALRDTYPVVVVDNGLSEACAELVASRPTATYLRPDRNLGFAGGVNAALASGHVHGDVLLLNPDARILPDDVARLHDVLRAPGARIACAAPRLAQSDSGEPQRVAWPFPTPGRQWLIALGLGRLVREHGFLVGAVLLLHRDALDTVGPFDETFFLYAEETDWQRRAIRDGWSVRLVEDVTAEHVGGATSSSSTLQQAHFHAASETYVRKWHGTLGWASYRAASIAGTAARCCVPRVSVREPARARLPILLAGPVRYRDRVLGRQP